MALLNPGVSKYIDPGIVQKSKSSAEILKEKIAKKDADMNRNQIMLKDSKIRSTAGDGSNIHPDFGQVGSATHGKIGK